MGKNQKKLSKTRRKKKKKKERRKGGGRRRKMNTLRKIKGKGVKQQMASHVSSNPSKNSVIVRHEHTVHLGNVTNSNNTDMHTQHHKRKDTHQVTYKTQRLQIHMHTSTATKTPNLDNLSIKAKTRVPLTLC